jgi:putative ABC transport system substrate-binding protein
LVETGYVEGRNVVIDYRWTNGQTGQLPAMAADLVAGQVSVIVALGSTPAVRAAKAATTTIPIVFMLGTDPVELGLVASLNRPGGNLTGVVNLNHHLAQKWLEVLHQLAPAASFAVLVDAGNAATASLYTREMQAAARALGLQMHIIQASSDRDFDAIFATLRDLRVGALVIVAALPFISHIEELAALTLRHGVPAVFPFREFAAAGGLVSYGTDLADTYRLAGVYTGRILKGERPSDLPVQQATKIQLIINLKTARVLGLTVPPTLLARADEVIE